MKNVSLGTQLWVLHLIYMVSCLPLFPPTQSKAYSPVNIFSKFSLFRLYLPLEIVKEFQKLIPFKESHFFFQELLLLLLSHFSHV